MINKTYQPYLKKLLLMLLVPLTLLSLTSCKGQEKVDTLDYEKTYIQISDSKVTQGELYDELKWKSAKIIKEKQKEIFLQPIVKDIEAALEDSKHEKHKEYLKEVQKKFIREVLEITESEELGDIKLDREAPDYEYERYKLMTDNEIKLHIKNYYDIYFFKGTDLDYLDLEGMFVNKKLTYDRDTDLYNLDNAKLKKQYKTNIQDIALKIFNTEEEAKEVEKEFKKKKEYYDANKVVEQYFKKFAVQGDFKAFIVDTKSQETINKKFGIVESTESLYYLKKGTRTTKEYIEYISKLRVDERETKEEELISLNRINSKSFKLQLLIAMYNYLNPYKEQIKNLDFEKEKIEYDSDCIDFTLKLITYYNNLIKKGNFDDKKRLNDVYNNIQLEVRDKFSYTREEVNKIDKILYQTLHKETLKPEEEQNNNPFNGLRYTFVFEYIGTEDDKKINHSLTAEKRNEELKNDKELYDKIIESLKKDEAEAKAKTSKALDEKLKKVKTYIYDKNLEIAFSRENEDHSRTFGKPRTNNIVCTLKYEKETFDIELYNGKDGLYDQLEREYGFDTAIKIIADQKIKSLDMYKTIPNSEIDRFKEIINNELTMFVNGSTGASPKIGKYNYLMSTYHTANVNEIIDDVFKINYVRNRYIINYTNDKLLNQYVSYANKQAKKQYPNTVKSIQIILDKDDDGIPDEVTDIETFKKDTKELLALAYKYLTQIKEKDSSTTFKTAYNNANYYKIDKNDTGDKYSAYKVKGYKVLESDLKLFEQEIKENNQEIKGSIDNFDLTFKKYTSLLLNETKMIDTIRVSNAYYPIINKDGKVFDVTTENLNNTSNTVFKNNKMTYIYYEGRNDFKTERLNFTFTEEDDQNKIYVNKIYYYNNDTVRIDNLYSPDGLITKNQVQAYLISRANGEQDTQIPRKISSSVGEVISDLYSKMSSRIMINEINLVFILSNTIDEADIEKKGIKAKYINFRDVNLQTHYERYKDYLIRREIFGSNDEYIIKGEITAYNDLIQNIGKFFLKHFNGGAN